MIEKIFNFILSIIKGILGLFIALAVPYFILVGMEWVRLTSPAEEVQKPFIVVSEEKTDNGVIYEGIGYSIEYSFGDKSDKSKITSKVYKAFGKRINGEFNIFN